MFWLLLLVASGCGDGEGADSGGAQDGGPDEPPPQSRPATGAVRGAHDGIALTLRHEGGEAPALVLELRNESDARRVLPISVCGSFTWGNAVQLTLHGADGKVHHVPGASGIDITALHPHFPVALGARENVTARLKLPDAFVEHGVGWEDATRGLEKVEITAELAVGPVAPRFEQGDRPPLTLWMAYYAEASRDSFMGEIPERYRTEVPPDFTESWPAWAWRGGKISTPRLSVPVR